MNQLKAAEDTMTFASLLHMDEIKINTPELDYKHLRMMLIRMQTEPFSEGKMGRWLGWMQCAVVAARIGATLDDMKKINEKHSVEVFE